MSTTPTQAQLAVELAMPESSRARARTEQRTVRPAGYTGNQAALRRQSRANPRLQRKVTIGAVNDPLEAEADRVAGQVMRMPDPAPSATAAPEVLRRKCAACDETLHRKCATCEEEDKRLRKKGDGGNAPAGEAPPIVHDVLSTPGQPLDTATRAFFEPRFGQDFSEVHVHADSKAAESARAVGAMAYTVGSNVVMGSGRYSPVTSEGRHLLAHELTHVVQQRAGFSQMAAPLGVSPKNSALESEADRVANVLVDGGGRQAEVVPQNRQSLQRSCGPDDIGSPSGCVGLGGDLDGERFLFTVNCDEFRQIPEPVGDEEARLAAFGNTLNAGDTIEIHGFASLEGDAGFNSNLSCARAVAALAVLQPFAPPSVTFRLFAHGATPGDAETHRSVVILRNPAPTPVPPSCAPPSACPPDFCKPMSLAAALADRAFSSDVLLAGIVLAVSPRVIPLWNLYIKGGTATTQDISAQFAPDFISDSITAHATNLLLDAIGDDLRANPPVFSPGTGSIVMNVDSSFGSSTAAAIAKIRTPGDPDSMTFTPATTIPGNLAGGIGANQAACPAGAIPSTIDDDRLVSGTVTITQDPSSSGWLVDPNITYTVVDTIDFCPGNCGSGLALQATVPFSRWEASGISGDVPFTVQFPAPKPASFTVMPAATTTP